MKRPSGLRLSERRSKLAGSSPTQRLRCQAYVIQSTAAASFPAPTRRGECWRVLATVMSSQSSLLIQGIADSEARCISQVCELLQSKVKESSSGWEQHIRTWEQDIINSAFVS